MNSPQPSLLLSYLITLIIYRIPFRGTFFLLQRLQLSIVFAPCLSAPFYRCGKLSHRDIKYLAQGYVVSPF